VIAAIVGCLLIGNPPVKGDLLAPFETSEPSQGVFTWKPGRVTVICAFAYWCDTWKTQRERLMATRKKMIGMPVDFLAVSVDGQWMEVDKKADWSRRLVDVGGQWSQSLGIDRVPYTLIVDESGTIRSATFGISRSDDLVKEIRESLTPRTSTENTIYLSFDDFPAKSGNAELLDALRLAGVNASLFIIGENAAANPTWVSRAAADGNHIEVHGWKHTAEDSQPERCKQWIEQYIGQSPKWVRGPGSSVIQDFTGQAFQTNEVDPYDFLRPGEPELLRRIMGNLKPGSTLHLHAGVPETVAVLPEVIERGRKLGLKFEPLP
jgi:peptidoglycan/xylan/chitin deacetylase (PgdA/CDA1 family)